MSGVERLVPRFVGNVPEELAPGVIYVAAEHGVMMHLCACGCGCEVSLPLSPLDWRLTFDGDTISVSPSVGNWSLPCRSHYVIDGGAVRWAGDWTDEEIMEGRRRDRRRRQERHGASEGSKLGGDEPIGTVPVQRAAPPRHVGLLGAARRWVARMTRRR